MNLTFQRIDGSEIAQQRILSAAERAVVLDPQSAGGYFVRGYVLAYVAGNLSAGLGQFALALQLNPNLADAWLCYGASERSLPRHRLATNPGCSLGPVGPTCGGPRS